MAVLRRNYRAIAGGLAEVREKFLAVAGSGCQKNGGPSRAREWSGGKAMTGAMLLDDSLREIARTIDVYAVLQGHEVGEELERDDLKQRQ